MTPILIKIYGAFHPADEICFAAVQRAGSAAIASAADDPCPWLLLEGGLLSISFEGLSFPVDDVLTALAATLRAHTQGKLDILDMEAWTLTRHQWRSGAFHSSQRGLNEVLDHSGH